MRHFARIWVCLVFVFAFARGARAANWYDGSPSRVQHTCNNWVSQTQEDLLWTYVGFQDIDAGNTTRLPQTGDVYYMHVMMAGLGCGGVWTRPELALPKNTSFAVSTAKPIRCWVETIGQNDRQALTPCPSQPTTGSYGSAFYAFPPPTQPYWPIPSGKIVTIDVPVTSTSSLSGIATNDYVGAAVNLIDNNPGGGNPPWDGPGTGWNGTSLPSQGAWQGVFVTTAGAPRSPYVGYSDTSAVPTTTTATTDMTIYNYDCVVSGQLQSDLLPVVNQPDSSQFVSGNCIAGCCSGTCALGASATWRFSWSTLTPDRDYEWRGYLKNITVTPNVCNTSLADAQTNATNPQWAHFHSLPLNGKPPSYSLLLHASAGGALAANPQTSQGSTTYSPGTQVTVDATPDPGYMLQSLTLDGTATAAPISITMSTSHAIDAVFVVDPNAQDAGAQGDGGTSSGGGGGCDAGGGRGSSWAAVVSLALLAFARKRSRE